jgi:hypothetical protein
MHTRTKATSKSSYHGFSYNRLRCRRFYYVDERKPNGAPKYRVDGDAHADLYWALSQGKEQEPWMQTFVKGEGYKKFDTLYTPIA